LGIKKLVDICLAEKWGGGVLGNGLDIKAWSIWNGRSPVREDVYSTEDGVIGNKFRSRYVNFVISFGLNNSLFRWLSCAL
jgi:hypothetical protein